MLSQMEKLGTQARTEATKEGQLDEMESALSVMEKDFEKRLREIQTEAPQQYTHIRQRFLK